MDCLIGNNSHYVSFDTVWYRLIPYVSFRVSCFNCQKAWHRVSKGIIFQNLAQLQGSCKLVLTQNAEQVLTQNAFQFFDILKLNVLKCCETPKGRELHTVKGRGISFHVEEVCILKFDCVIRQSWLYPLCRLFIPSSAGAIKLLRCFILIGSDYGKSRIVIEVSISYNHNFSENLCLVQKSLTHIGY